MSYRRVRRGLVMAVGVMAAVVCAGRALPAPAAPETISLVYLTKADEEGARNSLNDPVEAEYGWQGAAFGLDEINVSGRLLGKQYRLIKVMLPEGGRPSKAADEIFADGHRLIIADLKAQDLLELAALPQASDALILDARTSDDRLRQSDCRGNVFHLLPNWAMRADALGQYLARKGWKRWFVLTGTAGDDRAYAAAVKRTAARVGATIVQSGEVHTESAAGGGVQGPGGGAQGPGDGAQGQIAAQTHISAAYDVLIALDSRDEFGESLLFNTWDPRLVAGTHGLTAVAWHPRFKEYAARGIQYRFQRAAAREMTERDYGNWLATAVFAEAITRSGSATAAALKQYLSTDTFSVPANKGEGLSFRRWDHQLRQPLLLFGPRVLVSMWPRDSGNGGPSLTDTLGYDRADSECHMGREHGR